MEFEPDHVAWIIEKTYKPKFEKAKRLVKIFIVYDMLIRLHSLCSKGDSTKHNLTKEYLNTFADLMNWSYSIEMQYEAMDDNPDKIDLQTSIGNVLGDFQERVDDTDTHIILCLKLISDLVSDLQITSKNKGKQEQQFWNIFTASYKLMEYHWLR